MSGVNPPGPGNPPIGGPSGGGSTGSTSSITSLDTIQSMSLLEYLDVQTSASLGLLHQKYREAVESPLNLRDVHRALAQASTAYQLLLNLSNLSVANAWAFLFASQENIQDELDTYNDNLPTLQNAAQTLNDAIEAYENSDKGPAAQQALLDAMSTYTGTVTPIVNQYNNAVDLYNLFLVQSANALSRLNAELTARGEPNVITTPAPISSLPLTIDFDNPVQIPLPVTVPSSIGVSPPPDPTVVASIIDSSFQQQISSFLAFINSQQGSLANYIARLDASQGRDPNDPASKKLTAPPSYVDSEPVKEANTAAQSTGPGPSSVSVALGLRNTPELNRVLSKTVFDAITTKQNDPVTENLVQQMQIFALLILRNAAATAANDTAGSGEAPRLFFNVGSALAFANNVVKAVNDGGLSSAVNLIINSNTDGTNLTSTGRQDLVNALTNALSLALLQIAVSQVSQAAGNPTLLSQFTNLGLKEAGLSSPNTTIPTGASQSLATTLLNNPLSLESASAAIAESSESTPGFAADSVTNAISSQNPTSGFAQFGAATTAALSSAGVPASTASELGISVGFAAANTLAQSYNNLPFTPGELPALSAALNQSQEIVPSGNALPPELGSLAPSASFERSTLTALYQEGLSNPVFANALSETLGNAATQFETIGKFHDELLDNIFKANAEESDKKQAEHLANLATILRGKHAQEAHAQVSSRSELSELVTESLEANAKSAIGNSGAFNAVVQRAADTVTGILEAYNTHLINLRERARDDETNRDIRVTETVQSFVKHVRDTNEDLLPNSVFATNLNHAIKTQVEAVQTGTLPTDRASLRTGEDIEPTRQGTFVQKPDIDIRI